MPRKQFSQDLIDKVINLYTINMLNTAEIARLTEVGDKSAIRKILIRNNVQIRKNTGLFKDGKKKTLLPEQERLIVAFYEQGLSTGDVAKELSLPSSAVYETLKEKGVKIRSRSESKLKFTGDSEVKIKDLYLEGKTVDDITAILGCGRKAILSALKRQGVKFVNVDRVYMDKHNLTVTHWDTVRSKVEEIADLYNKGMSVQELADVYNVGSHFMFKLLEENKIERRSVKIFHFNEEFFDDLNNELSAYWLGFIYADGYSNKGRGLQIALSQKDIKHLESFTKEINFTGNLKLYEVNGRGNCKLFLNSVYLGSKLLQYGIVKSRGSFHLTEKYIPKQQACHFIRGFFDGDGFAGIRPRLDFLGQQDILSWVIDTLKSEVGVDAPTWKTRKGILEVSWYAIKECKAISDFMYNGATIFLQRKRDRVDKWTCKYEGNNGKSKGWFKPKHLGV